ncbi:Pycsar system effector family protein [Sciscionella sediminilitoris]|uniref:Pycsar system effector family protein n=1 Tax=Sciscionella sediminilitoris TaxID=1445613 RepID=UPI00056859ED|nr:Pycsar system effector family protein [Sciscionella sp. SE31]
MSVDTVVIAHEQARDELRRADTKATTLLSLIGASLAGVIALSRAHMPGAASVLLWCAAVPIAGAVVVLLLAIRPRLSAGSKGSWLHAIAADTTAVLAVEDEATHRRYLAEHTRDLAGIALAKFGRIRTAIRLLLAGLAVLAAALITGALL